MQTHPRELSFYATPDEGQAESLLTEYLSFLEKRNGGLLPEKGFAKREDWLSATEGWSARHQGAFSKELFDRNFLSYNRDDHLSKAQIALLAFSKVNAGEAYGVEVVSQHRHTKGVVKGSVVCPHCQNPSAFLFENAKPPLYDMCKTCKTGFEVLWPPMSANES